MTWEKICPVAFPHGKTKNYGFVIDHPTYWGIPISGDIADKPPPSDQANYHQIKHPPKTLELSDIDISVANCADNAWTGGNFTVFATCTPPLFHAYHHKTDVAKAPHAFELRSQRNIVEREFQPRNPLRGHGADVCVKLFDASFENGAPIQKTISRPEPIPFAAFDSSEQIRVAEQEQYFQVRNGCWDVAKIRPLNAIWFVVLHGENTPLARLGGGYRLWHRLSGGHGGGHGASEDPVKDGYDWLIHQDEANKHHYQVSIELSGTHNDPDNNWLNCPNETASVLFEYEWV